MTRIAKVLGMVLMGGLLMGVGSGVAQQHEQHQATPPAAAGTEQKMDMAACPHMQLGELGDKLLASFADIEEERDMAVLKQKLAAHGETLKRLKAVTEQKCPMMHMMGSGMMGSGSMMNMPGMEHPASQK